VRLWHTKHQKVPADLLLIRHLVMPTEVPQVTQATVGMLASTWTSSNDGRALLEGCSAVSNPNSLAAITFSESGAAAASVGGITASVDAIALGEASSSASAAASPTDGDVSMPSMDAAVVLGEISMAVIGGMGGAMISASSRDKSDGAFLHVGQRNSAPGSNAAIIPSRQYL